jgi:hypothetical protein
VRFVVPNDPSLAGSNLYFQALIFDPTMPQGYALSNGLEARFGY